MSGLFNYMDNITGKRFHKLTILRLESKKNGWRLMRCKCECGAECIKRLDHLQTGFVKSCGCLIAKVGERWNRLYQIWAGMKSRCNNKNRRCYHNYGGRGIKVEWKSYDEFRDDMEVSFVEHVWRFGMRNTSIERIDNDGNYNKANCRWATYSEQAVNRKRKPV